MHGKTVFFFLMGLALALNACGGGARNGPCPDGYWPFYDQQGTWTCIAFDGGSRQTVAADAGTPDAGAPDAGAPDSGSADAGMVADAGEPDVAVADAGVRDAVSEAGPDAGADAEVADAGSDGDTDAGAPDAGVRDAASEAGPDAGADAAVADAGADSGNAGAPSFRFTYRWEPELAIPSAFELDGCFGDRLVEESGQLVVVCRDDLWESPQFVLGEEATEFTVDFEEACGLYWGFNAVRMADVFWAVDGGFLDRGLHRIVNNETGAEIVMSQSDVVFYNDYNEFVVVELPCDP